MLLLRGSDIWIADVDCGGSKSCQRQWGRSGFILVTIKRSYGATWWQTFDTSKSAITYFWVAILAARKPSGSFRLFTASPFDILDLHVSIPTPADACLSFWPPLFGVFTCFTIMWVPKLFFVPSRLSQELHWKCQSAVISDLVRDKLLFQLLSLARKKVTVIFVCFLFHKEFTIHVWWIENLCRYRQLYKKNDSF